MFFTPVLGGSAPDTEILLNHEIDFLPGDLDS